MNTECLAAIEQLKVRLVERVEEFVAEAHLALKAGEMDKYERQWDTLEGTHTPESDGHLRLG